jgi:hypothetical protein
MFSLALCWLFLIITLLTLLSAYIKCPVYINVPLTFAEPKKGNYLGYVSISTKDITKIKIGWSVTVKFKTSQTDYAIMEARLLPIIQNTRSPDIKLLTIEFNKNKFENLRSSSNTTQSVEIFITNESLLHRIKMGLLGFN